LIVQSVISITFLIASINHLLGLYQTIGMLFIFLACLGISNPNTAGNSSSIYKKMQCVVAWRDSAGIRCVCFAVAFVKDSMVPMVVIMTVSTIAALIFLRGILLLNIKSWWLLLNI
jgi:DHA1 family bicyclomycin/chloramphenicol resistance-like MFS transporter